MEQPARGRRLALGTHKQSPLVPECPKLPLRGFSFG